MAFLGMLQTISIVIGLSSLTVRLVETCMMKTKSYHRPVLKHPVDFILGDLLIQKATMSLSLP